MATIALEAEARSVTGRQIHQLRRQGLVPAVVYGHNTPTVAIQIKETEMELTLRRAGFTRLIDLQVAGGNGSSSDMVLVREIQRHPIRRTLLHIDFYRVVMTEKIRVEVPIHFVGESVAVKEGATLVQNLNALEVECLPGDIPDSIRVDVSVLTATTHSIPVSAVQVPANVTVLADPGAFVVSVVFARAAEEEEGAAGAESTAEEPEVVAKGKAARGEEGEED